MEGLIKKMDRGNQIRKKKRSEDFRGIIDHDRVVGSLD